MHDVNISGRILVFAKAPITGLCKTRLGSKAGMVRAVRIHKRLVQRTLMTVTASSRQPVELHCAPDTRHPYFHHLARQFSVSLHPQVSGHLGRRMHRAIQRSLKNSDATIVIGTDCPALSPYAIERCFAELSDGADVVFIPSTDGGYALIGLRRPTPQIFSDIDWGTPQVMRQTRQRLRQAGLLWTELAPLADVDEYSDYLHALQSYPDIRA